MNAVKQNWVDQLFSTKSLSISPVKETPVQSPEDRTFSRVFSDEQATTTKPLVREPERKAAEQSPNSSAVEPEKKASEQSQKSSTVEPEKKASEPATKKTTIEEKKETELKQEPVPVFQQPVQTLEEVKSALLQENLIRVAAQFSKPVEKPLVSEKKTILLSAFSKSKDTKTIPASEKLTDAKLKSYFPKEEKQFFSQVQILDQVEKSETGKTTTLETGKPVKVEKESIKGKLVPLQLEKKNEAQNPVSAEVPEKSGKESIVLSKKQPSPNVSTEFKQPVTDATAENANNKSSQKTGKKESTTTVEPRKTPLLSTNDTPKAESRQNLNPQETVKKENAAVTVEPGKSLVQSVDDTLKGEGKKNLILQETGKKESAAVTVEPGKTPLLSANETQRAAGKKNLIQQSTGTKESATVTTETEKTPFLPVKEAAKGEVKQARILQESSLENNDSKGKKAIENAAMNPAKKVSVAFEPKETVTEKADEGNSRKAERKTSTKLLTAQTEPTTSSNSTNNAEKVVKEPIQRNLVQETTGKIATKRVVEDQTIQKSEIGLPKPIRASEESVQPLVIALKSVKTQLKPETILQTTETKAMPQAWENYKNLFFEKDILKVKLDTYLLKFTQKVSNPQDVSFSSSKPLEKSDGVQVPAESRSVENLSFRIFTPLKSGYYSDLSASRAQDLQTLQNNPVVEEQIPLEKNTVTEKPIKAIEQTITQEKQVENTLKGVQNSDSAEGNREERSDQNSQEGVWVRTPLLRENSQISESQVTNNINEIIQKIRDLNLLASTRARTVETAILQLNPPEIGKVIVEVVKEGNAISVILKVETQEAKELLEKNSHLLNQRLTQAGFDAQKVQVQMEKYDEQGQGKEESSQQNASDQKQKQEKQQEEKESNSKEPAFASFADLLRGGVFNDIRSN